MDKWDKKKVRGLWYFLWSIENMTQSSFFFILKSKVLFLKKYFQKKDFLFRFKWMFTVLSAIFSERKLDALNKTKIECFDFFSRLWTNEIKKVRGLWYFLWSIENMTQSSFFILKSKVLFFWKSIFQKRFSISFLSGCLRFWAQFSLRENWMRSIKRNRMLRFLL